MSVPFYEILIVCPIWLWLILNMTNNNGWVGREVKFPMERSVELG